MSSAPCSRRRALFMLAAAVVVGTVTPAVEAGRYYHSSARISGSRYTSVRRRSYQPNVTYVNDDDGYSYRAGGGFQDTARTIRPGSLQERPSRELAGDRRNDYYRQRSRYRYYR